MDVTSYINISISLLAVLNPVGTMAIYISLMGDRTPAELNSIAVRFTIAILIITAISEWLGHYFLQLFGINLPSFEVAGGIILALVGLSMILPKPGNAEKHTAVTPKNDQAASTSIAVVPLAIPIAAGPGVIALVIASAEKMHGLVVDKLIFAALLVVLCLIMGLTMKAAPSIHKKLSATAMATVSRIMGLVITAIGMNMLANGMLGLFPGLR